MNILALQIVAETFPSARLRRKLLVTILETEIVGMASIDCPYLVSNGITCKQVISLSTLELVDEDPKAVEAGYIGSMNAAIRDGRLKATFEEVSPDSSIVVMNHVPETPAATTASPTTTTPTTPSPTSVETATLSPATLGLTTTAPTTVGPTTIAPTTVGPTTIAPTTPSPITIGPTTMAPTTPSPITIGPTTDSPTPSPTTYNDFLSSLLAERSPWSVEALKVPDSAQRQAFDWLLADEVTRDLEEPDQDRILQRFALATLFYAMDDDDFMDETWLTATDECTWSGVDACSSAGGLQNLTIDQDNMKALPLELGLLTNLVEFDAFADVYNVDVQSHITLLPTTIGLLTGMKRFDVAYYVDGLPEERGYTGGPIPSELGQMTALKELRFGGAFTGTLPQQIGGLVGLTELEINGGMITGPIPGQIDELTKLTYLDLGGSKFVGGIPKQIGSLSNLVYLNLGGNSIGGPFYSEVGDLSKLTSLWLGRCKLTGPIPSEVGELSLLRNLWLQENGLTGVIPTQMGTMTALEDIDFSFNALHGPIPSEIGRVSLLRIVRLEHNQLSSSLPTELGLLTNLSLFRSGNNQFEEKIPPLGSLTRLEVLHLGHNQLTGSIPVELQSLTDLRFLTLNDNKIDGSIPPALSKITSLEKLFLHNLDLVGTVPDSLCALSRLTPFYFTVDCSDVFCPCCHVCQTRETIDIAQYNWEDGAVDTKLSFHPIDHHGTLDDGVSAKDGKLTVYNDYGVDLGPISELDGATEVLFRFEDVNITDSRDWLYHVLLGGGYEKYWVAVYYDDYLAGAVRTELRFNIGGFGRPRAELVYDLGLGAVKFFDSIEYYFDASQPSNQRLAIRYNDGEWTRGGWNDSDWTTSFPVNDESVKINDGARADWDALNATLGQITIRANRP